jgi:hypothetical protein
MNSLQLFIFCNFFKYMWDVVVQHAYTCGLQWCKKHMYMGSIGVGRVNLQKMGFLEEQLSDGLEKNESKRAKGQVCMCREI